MAERLRRFCWILLAGLLAGEVWLAANVMRFLYGELWPARPDPLTFGLLLILGLLRFASYPGVWSLFRVRIQGPGRVWWRVWVGILFGALPLQLYVRRAWWWIAGEEPLYWTDHPRLLVLLPLVAIAPLWILSGRQRTN